MAIIRSAFQQRLKPVVSQRVLKTDLKFSQGRDDPPAISVLAREHRALHAAVHSRCGDHLHGRDRPRLGPAPTGRSSHAPAVRHYIAQMNGLVQPWAGRVFLNPPFSPGVGRWFSKVYQERSRGRTTEAIVLRKSATEAAAWKTLTVISCRVCFPYVRIRFVGPAGDSGPGPTFSPAPFNVRDGPGSFSPYMFFAFPLCFQGYRFFLC